MQFIDKDIVLYDFFMFHNLKTVLFNESFSGKFKIHFISYIVEYKNNDW